MHGDYRIGNMLAVVAGEPVNGVPAARDHMCAVLDWELCTLGDVLADVGYFLNYWAQPGDDDDTFVDPPPSVAGGFSTARSSSPATRRAAASTSPRSSTTGRSATGAAPPSSRA